MAKKSASTSRRTTKAPRAQSKKNTYGRRRSSDKSIAASSNTDRNYREKVNDYVEKSKDYVGKSFDRSRESFGDFYARPSSKYIIGGIAAAAVLPFALRLLKKLPRFTSFVKENLDTVEDQIKDYRASTSLSDETTEAHH